MIKQLVTSTIFIASAIGVKAQYNFSQIHNQHAHNLASSQLPSLLGDDMRTGEVHLLNLYGGFANNFISAYDLQQFSQSGNLSNTYIDNVLNKMPKEATLWAGADLPIFNIFFNVNKKAREPFLSFGIGMRERVDFSMTMNKDLFSLIYKGNKQFADQTVNLSPSLNFLFYNEYFLAAAAQLKLPDIGKLKTITIKPAVRLRMLNGLASIYMPDSHIDMYTHPDGRYIDFTTSLQANMSAAVDTPDFESTLDNIDLQSFKSSGKGFGMDLGLGVTLFENFQAHLGLIDMGSINFNRNTINYTKNDTYTYDGIDINQQGDAINTGNLDEMLQPEKTYNSYKMPLPTKLILSGSYQYRKKAKRKVTYFVHNVSLTYVQGFRNYLSSTKKPALNVGYAYNFKNLVNTGASFTVGGVNKVMAGAHLGFRLCAIKLGLASNNFLPLLSAKAGRGTDVNMYLGFYF
jgi:hypothetical protein